MLVGDEHAADLHLLAQGTGDVDVEAAEPAILVERGEGRRCRLHADAQLAPLQRHGRSGKAATSSSDGEQQERAHAQLPIRWRPGPSRRSVAASAARAGSGCSARCSTARTVAAKAWLTAS